MAEQEKKAYISVKSNSFELVLQVQHEAHALIHSFETFILESMILRVEHNIKLDEATNKQYLVEKSCKHGIFDFAKQTKIEGQKG